MSLFRISEELGYLANGKSSCWNLNAQLVFCNSSSKGIKVWFSGGRNHFECAQNSSCRFTTHIVFPLCLSSLTPWKPLSHAPLSLQLLTKGCALVSLAPQECCAPFWISLPLQYRCIPTSISLYCLCAPLTSHGTLLRHNISKGNTPMTSWVLL